MKSPQSLLDDYYKILNIKAGAPIQVVKKAYRMQVKFWHPDRFPSMSKKMLQQVGGKLQEVNFAYKRLDEHLKSIASVEVKAKPKVESVSPEEGVPETPPITPEKKEKPSERKAEPIATPGEDINKTREEVNELPKEKPPAKAEPLKPQEKYWNLKPEEVTFSWKTGDQYCGETIAGRMHGYGTYYYAIGHKYVGEFHNGLPHGRGTFYYVNGDVFAGDFVNDLIEGFGTYDYVNGDKYIGQFKDGLPHGQGTYTLVSGSQHYGIWDKGNIVG